VDLEALAPLAEEARFLLDALGEGDALGDEDIARG
jgi:hypothetical protein